MLQWGRGRVTAERRIMSTRPSGSHELQWGRGRVTAERFSGSDIESKDSGFNGAAVV